MYYTLGRFLIIKILTKKFMSIEEGFIRRNVRKVKKAVGIGVLVGASLLSPQLQREAEASQKAIAQAEAAVDLAKFDVEHTQPNTQARLEAERRLAEAKGGLKTAIGEDRDEKADKVTSASKIGVAPEAKIKATSREVDIIEDGKVIGHASEKSEAQVEFEKFQIKKDAEVRKKEAEANRPIVVNDNLYGVNSGGVIINDGRRSPPPPSTNRGSHGGNVTYRPGSGGR